MLGPILDLKEGPPSPNKFLSTTVHTDSFAMGPIFGLEIAQLLPTLASSKKAKDYLWSVVQILYHVDDDGYNDNETCYTWASYPVVSISLSSFSRCVFVSYLYCVSVFVHCIVWCLSWVYLRKQSQPNGLPEPCDYDVDCGHWNQDHDVNIHINVGHNDGDNGIEYIFRYNINTMLSLMIWLEICLTFETSLRLMVTIAVLLVFGFKKGQFDQDNH